MKYVAGGREKKKKKRKECVEKVYGSNVMTHYFVFSDPY